MCVRVLVCARMLLAVNAMLRVCVFDFAMSTELISG